MTPPVRDAASKTVGPAIHLRDLPLQLWYPERTLSFSRVLEAGRVHAFVGKSPGRYQLWLGGNTAGTRLNQLFKDMVKDTEIENELRPILARFAKERNGGERFGDWCYRVVLKEQPMAAN